MTMPTPEQLQQLPPEYLAEDVTHPLLSTSISLIVLVTIAFCIFISSRFLIESAKGIETWFLMPLGYLTCLGNCVCAILMVKFGGCGHHTAKYLLSDPGVIVTALKLVVVEEWFAAFSVAPPKLAVLALYLRIFKKKWVRYATWLTGAVVILNGVQFLIAASLVCRPYAFKWNKTLPNGHCGNIMAIYKYGSIPPIITDVGILILPIPGLHELQMSFSRRLGVMFTFVIGGFGIITAIIRFVNYSTTDLMSDVTFHGAKIELWTIIDSSVYFICSCLLGMPPIVRYAFKRTNTFAFVHRLAFDSRKRGTSTKAVPGRFHSLDDAAVSKDPNVSLRLSSVESNRSAFLQFEGDRFERTPNHLEAGFQAHPNHFSSPKSGYI